MTRRLGLALAAFVLAAPVAVRAELSINGHGDTWYFQAEPGLVWTKHREGVPTSHLLNPFGDSRSDGAPSVALNPATGVVDVAWGRGGSRPGIAFATWDDAAGSWKILESAADAGSIAPRTVQLAHDTFGNRYIVHDDPSRGRVLLASAQYDGHALNRAIVIGDTRVPAASPAVLWDGRVLVIAYSRLDGRSGLEIAELEPEVDERGRIPNGGEGVPGIPEPVFQYSSSAPLPMSAVLPSRIISPLPGGAPPPEPVVPALVQLEMLPDMRILASWIAGSELGFTVRTDGTWGLPRFVPLADPVDHAAARAEVRQLVASRGRGRAGR